MWAWVINSFGSVLLVHAYLQWLINLTDVALRGWILIKSYTFCRSINYFPLLWTQNWPGGVLKNTYELLNLRALKISKLHKNHIFQCMGKIFCVEFQRVPLKFHTKYLTHTLKDVDFIFGQYKKSLVTMSKWLAISFMMKSQHMYNISNEPIVWSFSLCHVNCIFYISNTSKLQYFLI